MKTTWMSRPKFLRTLALLCAAGCLTLWPAAWAGEQAAPAAAEPAATVSAAPPAKPAKQATKAPKKAKPSKPARAAKKQAASPAPVLTGSHLPQRTVLRRFPETTSPVEIWDRRVIERRGEATLGGFLARQATFR